jgi:hypothetical protein
MTSLLSSPVLTILLPLTDATPEAEDVTPGWIYPLVFFSLVAVTILLWFSMRKQLKKIRFPEDESDARPDDDQDRPADGDPLR